jgi:hypothetical protein
VDSEIVDALLQSSEPSIRYKTLTEVLGEDAASKKCRALREEIRRSPRVRALLAHRDPQGRIVCKSGVYAKWQGAHWVLATLADIGYPPHDDSLLAARDQVLGEWLAPSYYEEFVAERKEDAYKKHGVPVMEGRHRRCASQQGYTLYYLLKLGLEHPRLHDLAERLLHWRWPDGGWNCDKDPRAHKSSFIHTVHCMRALHAYGERFGDAQARAAADQAAEIFLSRRLYKRIATGAVIKEEFTFLHYPLYWHYDILLSLKVLAEMGKLEEPRCSDAIALLESKRLRDGGFPAERRYYKASTDVKLGNDWVDWGGTSKTRPNPWVTVDALAVLRKAGRA